MKARWQGRSKERGLAVPSACAPPPSDARDGLAVLPRSGTRSSVNDTCTLSNLSRLTGVKPHVLEQYLRSGPVESSGRNSFTGRLAFQRADLIRLEKLVFAEVLGLAGNEIANEPPAGRHVISELECQRSVLMELRRRLNRVIYFIEYAQEMNRYPWSDDWHSVASVIEAINQYRERESLQSCYRGDSSDDRKAGEVRTGRAATQRGQ